MTRTVELYGRLREYGPSLTIELPRSCTAKSALAAVARVLPPQALVGCALATADSVLSGTDHVPDSGRLAVLPPVCGG